MMLLSMNQFSICIFVAETQLSPVPRVAPILRCIIYPLNDGKKTQFIALNMSLSKKVKNTMLIKAAASCSSSQWKPGIFTKFTWKRLRKNRGFHKITYNQRIWILGSYCNILKYTSEWECLNLKRCCHQLSFSDKRSFHIHQISPTHKRYMERRNVV